jgi:hypothetical protein
MDPSTLDNLAQGGAGALSVLAGVIGALMTDALVTGRRYKDMVQERDFWRSRALRQFRGRPDVDTEALR